jgi:predicted MFS family arabinose efflux permease
MKPVLATAFVRWAFARSALARGWWLTTALYLVVVADLSPAQLVLVGVFQGLTVVIAEVPAGVVADAVSRRRAQVVAHAVMGSGMALTALVTTYWAIVAAQCLWGLGWAISSGADVAWITDELDRVDIIDRVLVSQGRYELSGTAVGIVSFGTLAWATTLSTAILVAGLAMIALGAVVVARWPEDRFTPSPADRRWRSATTIFRRGVSTARDDHVIALVLVATLLVNGGAEGYGRLFERRLLGLGMPTDPNPIVWFATIALSATAIGALTLRRVEARIDRADIARRTHVAACALGALGLAVFALAPNLQWAVAGSLVVFGTGFPVARVASTIMVNRRTTSEARATVHSMLSQAENLGEIVCGLGLALVADATSSTVTLLASAGLVAAGGIVTSRARDRSNLARVVSGADAPFSPGGPSTQS